jgi:hypothetical protein
MKHRTFLIALVTASVGATLVAAVSVAGPKRKVFRPKDMPFEIAEDGPPARLRRGADKRLRFEQKVLVKIDGEKAGKPVTMKGDHADSAEGGHLQLTITAARGKTTNQFSFSPANNTIALSAGTSSVAITKNPDGSYTVGDKQAANGKGALELLRENPVYKGIPEENLLVAYAVAQSPLPEVKAGIITGNQGGAQGATGPAVCTVFKDLCDCVACDASAKRGACSLCK